MNKRDRKILSGIDKLITLLNKANQPALAAHIKNLQKLRKRFMSLSDRMKNLETMGVTEFTCPDCGTTTEITLLKKHISKCLVVCSDCGEKIWIEIR